LISNIVIGISVSDTNVMFIYKPIAYSYTQP